MECSKESLLDEEDQEVEVDKSALSQIFRVMKEMRASGNTHQRPKRFGRGPGGERDMDVDDEDYDDEEDNSVLSMVEVRARVLSAGFTEAQLMETVVTVSGTFVTYVV